MPINRVISRPAEPSIDAGVQEYIQPSARTAAPSEHSAIPVELAGLASQSGTRRPSFNSAQRANMLATSSTTVGLASPESVPRPSVSKSIPAALAGSSSIPARSRTLAPESSDLALQLPASLPKRKTAGSPLAALDENTKSRIEAMIHPASIEELRSFSEAQSKPANSPFKPAAAFNMARKAQPLKGAPTENPEINTAVRNALMKTPALKQFHTVNGGQINEELFEAAWNDAIKNGPEAAFNRNDPAAIRDFQGRIASHYTNSMKSAANDRFGGSVVGAVQEGGFNDWKAGDGASSIRVGHDQVSTWQHSRADSDSQRTSTRLADFVLSKNPDLKQEGTELQAVASGQHGRIVASMNNPEANAKLAQRYPDATALKDDLGKYIATELKTPPAPAARCKTIRTIAYVGPKSCILGSIRIPARNSPSRRTRKPGMPKSAYAC